MIYFISDTHFYHTNIIKYCNRPFKSMEEMNLAMINNWNSRVKKEDTIFHLGDLGFGYAPKESPDAPKHAHRTLLEQLNGEVILLKGNHDSNNGSKSIIESIIINHGTGRIFLTHNPKYAQEKYFFNFTGHLHGKNGKFTKLSYKSTIVDLSVENWNYSPVSYNEIWQSFSQWKKDEKIN